MLALSRSQMSGKLSLTHRQRWSPNDARQPSAARHPSSFLSETAGRQNSALYTKEMEVQRRRLTRHSQRTDREYSVSILSLAKPNYCSELCLQSWLLGSRSLKVSSSRPASGRKITLSFFKQPCQNSLVSDTFPTSDTQIKTIIITTSMLTRCYTVVVFT